jgi:hypothetical protein
MSALRYLALMSRIKRPLPGRSSATLGAKNGHAIALVRKAG